MHQETQALLSSLNNQREHVLGILEGLTEEQLRRPVLPSRWNCLGLVKHLAWEDEHFWFRTIVAGESLDFFPVWPGGHGGEWVVEPGESSADVRNLYRDEIARSDAIIEVTSPEAVPRQREEWWGQSTFVDFRTIMLHVIAETACHAGHLDAVRELLDGRQRIVQ